MAVNLASFVTKRFAELYQQSVRLGVVYDHDFATGLIRVQYDGQQDPAGYRYLASYTPAEGDRVLMLKAGAKWVILGKLAAT